MRGVRTGASGMNVKTTRNQKIGPIARAVFLVTAGVLLVSTAIACGRGKVAGLEVHRGTFTDTFLLTGQLEAVKSEDILVPSLPQWRTQITWMIRDGAHVHKGEKILELDYSSLASNLEEKKLAVSKAAGDLVQQKALNAATGFDLALDLKKTKADLDKAKIDASVPAELFSRKDYEDRQLALAAAETAYDQARAKMAAFEVSSKADLDIKRLALEKARRDITTAEKALKRMVVYAPRDGVVDVAEHPWQGRKLQIGDTVMVGWTVMSLPDLSSMLVDAKLSDVDEGRVQPGMKAVCTLDAFPNLAIDGYVRKVSPVAKPIGDSPTRRGFDVTIALDKGYPDKMRTGMSVKIAVETRRMKDVLLAPRSGLDLSADPPLARLAGGREVKVMLGPCSPMECVVESGLKAGQHLSPVGGGRG